MTEDTYAKVAQIADELLGKEGMHKYPFLLVIGRARARPALHRPLPAQAPDL